MDNLKALEVMKQTLDLFRSLRQEDREFLISKMKVDHQKLGDRFDAPLSELKRRYVASELGFIPAIQEIRATLGLSLKEAKETVEGWRNEMPF